MALGLFADRADEVVRLVCNVTFVDVAADVADVFVLDGFFLDVYKRQEQKRRPSRLQNKKRRHQKRPPRRNNSGAALNLSFFRAG